MPAHTHRAAPDSSCLDSLEFSRVVFSAWDLPVSHLSPGTPCPSQASSYKRSSLDRDGKLSFGLWLCLFLVPGFVLLAPLCQVCRGR